jgi:hypothetical protein
MTGGRMKKRPNKKRLTNWVKRPVALDHPAQKQAESEIDRLMFHSSKNLLKA